MHGNFCDGVGNIKNFTAHAIGLVADNHGDYSEPWLEDVTAAQESDLSAMLEATIDEWANKWMLQPTFYEARNVQEHTVTAEDGGDPVGEEVPSV